MSEDITHVGPVTQARTGEIAEWLELKNYAPARALEMLRNGTWRQDLEGARHRRPAHRMPEPEVPPAPPREDRSLDEEARATLDRLVDVVEQLQRQQQDEQIRRSTEAARQQAPISDYVVTPATTTSVCLTHRVPVYGCVHCAGRVV